MALGINDFSTKKTSLEKIVQDGITEQYLQTFDIDDMKTRTVNENDDKLNETELKNFIMAMGGNTVFTEDEARELAAWLLPSGTTQISISDIMQKLGGSDNVISADEIILLGDVFTPTLNGSKTGDDLDYLYNIFDENGTLKLNQIEELIGDIDTADNVEKLRMILIALGVNDAAITNIIAGLKSPDTNIKQGAIDFIENALKKPDTFVATMNKAEKVTIAELGKSGENGMATEKPLKTKNLKEPTVKEFTTAISTDGKIDKDKFAYVLVQMGLANDKTTADEIVENIRKNNNIDYTNTTPADLVVKLAKAGGTSVELDKTISHTDLRIASYMNQDGVDVKALEELLESTTDKKQIIKELYNKAGITIDPTTLTNLSKLEITEIINAIFGTIKADKNGNIPLTSIMSKPTAPGERAGEGNDKVEDFSKAVTTDGKPTSPVDATKLAKYLRTKGVIDSDTTDAEAKLIAENIIKFNGGSDVTGAELFANMAGDKVVGNDHNILTPDKIIASTFINQNDVVDISAFKAMLDANSDKSKVIDALYNSIGVKTAVKGKTSAEIANQSTDNIVKAVFGDINGADTVTAQSVKEFVEGTTETGATATEAKADGKGNIVISNGIIEPDTFTAYITDAKDKNKIDIDKLKQALKLLGFDDTFITNAVTAWGKLQPSNLTMFLKHDGKITKDTVVLGTAFIDYKTVDHAEAEDKAGVTDEHLNKHAVMNILNNSKTVDDRSNFLQALFIKLGISPEEARAFVMKLNLNDLEATEQALAKIGLFSGNKLDTTAITGAMENYTAPAPKAPAPKAPEPKAPAAIAPTAPTAPVAPVAPEIIDTIDEVITELGKQGDYDKKSNFLQDFLSKLGIDLTTVVRPFVMQLDLNDQVATKNALTEIGLFSKDTAEIGKLMSNYIQAPGDITTADSDNHGNYDKKLEYVTRRLKKIFNGTGEAKDYNASNPKQKFSASNGEDTIGHTDISWDEVFKRLASMTKVDIDKFFNSNDPNKIIEYIQDNIRKKEYFKDDDNDNYKH